VYLLPTFHQSKASERIVVFPTSQHTDSPDCSVHSSNSAAVALSPDHTFVIGWGNFATPQKKRTIRIENQLRVIEGSAVSLVNTYGKNHPRRLCRPPQSRGYGTRNFHRILIESQVFFASQNRRYDKRKIGIIGNKGFGENGQLYPLSSRLVDGVAHAIDSVTSRKVRRDLDCCRLEPLHAVRPSRSR
jgi:hypothetical protein